MKHYFSKEISQKLPKLPSINRNIKIEILNFDILTIKIIEHETDLKENFCGSDLGLRTFLTTFSPKASVYYNICHKTDIDILHKLVINHLLDLNDTVFIGLLNIKKDSINLFNSRLIKEAHLRKKNVYVIPEYYTTQTCSVCGLLNYVGSSSVYKCIYCNNRCCRDLNAAKNILIKGLTITKKQL